MVTTVAVRFRFGRPLRFRDALRERTYAVRLLAIEVIYPKRHGAMAQMNYRRGKCKCFGMNLPGPTIMG